jgi:HlyD family type I secretion membrane fusion protein
MKDKSRTWFAARQTRHLTKPLLMEDAVRPRVAVSLMVLTGVFIAAMTAWAAIAQMRELTVVTGRVKLVGSLSAIQNQEAGRVVKILVRQGQSVEKDTPLIHLRTITAMRNLEKLQMRRAYLLLQRERLEAALQQRLPRFGVIAGKYPALAREQRVISSQIRLSNANSRTLLAVRVNENNAKVDEFTGQITDLTRQIELQSGQLAIRRGLFKRGTVSRQTFWQTRRMYEKTHGELSDLRKRLKSELEALNEARTALLDFDAAVKKKRMDTYAGIKAGLGTLRHEIALLEQSAGMSFIRSPVRGVVLELISGKAGDMIDAGKPVAKVMPLNQEFYVEMQLAPDETTRLKIGQQMKVKITEVDGVHLGDVKGVVQTISATEVQSDTGRANHKVIIALGSNYIIKSNKRHVIRPGMMARMQLVLAARSLAGYVLKPLYKSATLALTRQ